MPKLTLNKTIKSSYKQAHLETSYYVYLATLHAAGSLSNHWANPVIRMTHGLVHRSFPGGTSLWLSVREVTEVIRKSSFEK